MDVLNTWFKELFITFQKFVSFRWLVCTNIHSKGYPENYANGSGRRLKDVIVTAPGNWNLVFISEECFDIYSHSFIH